MTHSSVWDANVGLASLFGLPVIEQPLIQRGHIVINGNLLMVRNMWSDLQLPMILADNRKAGRDHLMALVAAAEKRLGLADD